MSLVADRSTPVQSIIPAWALRHSAESLRDNMDLLSGIITPAYHARLADARAVTSRALELAEPGYCLDPDDLDPHDWPDDTAEYESASDWPEWTDCPIPYTLPPGELEGYLTLRHGDDHDGQPGDPGAIELGSCPSADWYDYEAMFGDGPDPDTQAEWDRKARQRRSA